MSNYEYLEDGSIGMQDVVFVPYEIGGVIFPGMGITYLDENFEFYPTIIFPADRVSCSLHHVLTAYAIDYYILDKKCHYFDRKTLTETLIKSRNYFFSLASLGFAVEEDNKWSLV